MCLASTSPLINSRFSWVLTTPERAPTALAVNEMGYCTATLNTSKLCDQRVGRAGANEVERSRAQQAHVIERDNDFAADDKFGQVVQVAHRPVFQNPSPEIHRRMQLSVDSFQFHKSGSAVHLVLRGFG